METGGGGEVVLGRRGEYGDAAALGNHGDNITGPGARNGGALLGQLQYRTTLT